VDTVGVEGDAVVAVVSRDRLSSVLTVVHRSGQGHNARVLDSARGDVKGQLRRAGVTTDLDLDHTGRDLVVMLIHAPGRAAKTADMLHRAGVNSVRVVSRAGAEVPRPFAVPAPANRPQPAIPAPEVSTN
jgi:hypothetical protein